MDTAGRTRIPLFERLQIESQSNCNRSCWFCTRTYDRSGKYLNEAGRAVFHQMPTDKILDLLDQAQGLGFRGIVGFYYQSEPLLDQRNIMLAREARKRGMKPYLPTNGDVLKHDDALCEQVKSVYDLVVVGLYDYKTNQELAEAKQTWKARLAGTNLRFSATGPLGARAAYSMGVPKALVPSDPRMAAPDLTYTNAPCHRPLVRLIIQYDGEMCNCCEDIHGVFRLGNAYSNSLEELWFSARRAQIVEDLIAGRWEKYALCGNCPQLPTGPAPDGKKIDIRPRRYTGETKTING